MIKKEKNEFVAWNEGFKAYFLEKCYQMQEGFYQEFYVQCIESTSADGYEIFLETPTHYNCFIEDNCSKKDILMMKFYKIVAIHHTVTVAKRRQEEVHWDTIKTYLFHVFQCSEKEKELTENLYKCIMVSSEQFQILMVKVTMRYLFDFKILDGLSFAFLGNFWYNSYRNFMSSFVGYIPFSVRIKRNEFKLGN